MSSTSPIKKRDESFGKEKRVRKRKEYLFIQEKGEKFRSRHFLMALSVDKGDNAATGCNHEMLPVGKLLISGEQPGDFRFGITVSKKVDKRAVARNKLRRRVREYLRRRISKVSIKGAIVVIAMKGSCELSYDDVSKELNYLLKKSGLTVARVG